MLLADGVVVHAPDRTEQPSRLATARDRSNPVDALILTASESELEDIRGADLERAIARLTRALATADDETIADLVSERRETS